MDSRRIAIIVVIAAVLFGGLYGLENLASPASPSNSITINISINGGVGAGTTDLYTPANFTVKEGQTVNLAILNTDDNTHGFVITALHIDTGKILPGHTDRISFVANQTGTFTYFEPPSYCTGGFGNVCNSVQHMTGNMTVTP